MKSLLVDGEYRHLRGAEVPGIVERADLQDHRGQSRPPGDQMGAAFGAEFPRHRILKVAARKLFGRSLGIAKAVGWHQHKHVGRAAGDVLAFAAVTLRFHHWLATDPATHPAAIAAPFQLHGTLPVLSSLRVLRQPSGFGNGFLLWPPSRLASADEASRQKK